MKSRLGIIVVLTVLLSACFDGGSDGDQNSTWDNMQWDSGSWQ